MQNFNPGAFVKNIPKAPEEIDIYQAVGLLTYFDNKSDKQSFVDRLRIHDPVIRTWSLTQLLVSGQDLDLRTIAMGMHVSPRSAYLRKKLGDYLLKSFQFDLFKQIYKSEKEKSQLAIGIQEKILIATYGNRYRDLIVLFEQMYLLTGDYQYVKDAAELARTRLNWRDAIKPLLRLMLTNGMPVASAAVNVLRMLERESAKDEFTAFSSVFRVKGLKGYNLTQAYSYAQMFYWAKDYQKCIDFLEKSNVLKVTESQTSLFTNLLAKCYDEIGNFSLAASFYQKQNLALKKENLTLTKFIKDLEHRASLPIDNMAKDPNTNYLIMTGFPRSGTTLLENVLSSHPKVMTCEETSSLLGSVFAAYKMPTKNDPRCEDINRRAIKHRHLYYENIKRHINKPDVSVVIDKTPIISANIKYMKKIFPEKKYIFSIRHPYDVVLSNYKQDYQPNIAMAAFNDIKEACQLYNYVMTQWFEVFPGQTPLVHYVKYDELVTNFDEVVRGTLDFLGVEWTDEVKKFAEHSAKRAVRTPSYANVRKGLSIGVQSSWRNYEFLFDDDCRSLLDPWVKRFAY